VILFHTAVGCRPGLQGPLATFAFDLYVLGGFFMWLIPFWLAGHYYPDALRDLWKRRRIGEMHGDASVPGAKPKGTLLHYCGYVLISLVALAALIQGAFALSRILR
jgi:hypothetical protein